MLTTTIAERGDAVAGRADRANPVRGALAGLSISMLLSSLGTSIANVALPTLAQAFTASFQEVQWVVLAYLLAVTTLIVMSVGPLFTAATGVPAGRLADRLGAQRVSIVGLVGIALGSFILSLLPATLGIVGYLAPVVVTTVGYALFQTANNTAVMAGVQPDQRGVISGLLNLSRNLGLITGASALGAVFALASTATDLTTARPEAVATGMRITFAVATGLTFIALGTATRSRRDSCFKS